MGTIILSIEPTRTIMGQQPSSPPIFTTLTQHFEEGKKATGKRVKAITKKVKSCHKETKKLQQGNKKAAPKKQKSCHKETKKNGAPLSRSAPFGLFI